MSVTYEYLHQILEYDPITSELRNKVDRKRSKAGKVHTATSGSGHIFIVLHGRQYMAHRITWFMETGAWPDLEIDHKNTVPNDNLWDNLREASPSQNRANRGALPQSKLGVKGVRKRGNRFQSQIRVPSQLICLGTYGTADEASAAYREAAEYVHGEFARA